jgi:hypothetical protein
MAMLIFRRLTSPTAARRSAQGKCVRLATVVAAVLGAGVLVAENGAEQVDSGWAVSTPAPIANGSKHTHPKQQITLNDVLHHSQTPLIKIPPQPAAAASADANKTTTITPAKQPGVRVAVRPDGVEGWRPASQFPGPLHEIRLHQATTPQLNEPPSQSSEGAPSESTASNAVVETAPSEPDAMDAATEQAAPVINDASTQQRPELAPLAQPDSTATDVESEAIEISQQPKRQSSKTDRPAAGDAIRDITIDDNPAAPPAATNTPPPPLTKQLISLRSKLRGVLKGYYRRQLNSRENDPWEAMHGMLAYGVHSRIRQGGSRGEPVTLVGWLCYNKPCKNLNLLYVNPKGQLRAKYGVGLQGHLGQFLAMLAQCHVSKDYPIRVGKREFTIEDLIEAEKKTCYPKSELTFKLLAFQYYLDLNDQWENDQGVDWDFRRLIREELAQPIRGAACGGTHRLSGLSLTVKTRLRRGEPLDGEYARAAEFVERYHQYAFRMQNRDGSLSTNWFRGRGDDSSIDRRIKTTGHILEWLCYSISDKELRDPKTIAAVSYLTNLMYSNYDHEWEVGPMCHAIHALLVYDERVFQPFDNADDTVVYKPKKRASTGSKPSSASLR